MTDHPAKKGRARFPDPSSGFELTADFIRSEEQKSLSIPARWVFVCLADRIPANTQRPFISTPSINTIAKDIGMSRNATIKILNELQVKGFLERAPRMDPKSGGKTSSESILTHPFPRIIMVRRRGRNPTGKNTPRGGCMETPTPSALETTTPSALESTTPSALETTRVGTLETTRGSTLETTTPSALETTTPSALESTQRNQVEENHFKKQYEETQKRAGAHACAHTWEREELEFPQLPEEDFDQVEGYAEFVAVWTGKTDSAENTYRQFVTTFPTHTRLMMDAKDEVKQNKSPGLAKAFIQRSVEAYIAGLIAKGKLADLSTRTVKRWVNSLEYNIPNSEDQPFPTYAMIYETHEWLKRKLGCNPSKEELREAIIDRYRNRIAGATP